eukprot:s29_g24.t1
MPFLTSECSCPLPMPPMPWHHGESERVAYKVAHFQAYAHLYYWSSLLNLPVQVEIEEAHSRSFKHIFLEKSGPNVVL